MAALSATSCAIPPAATALADATAVESEPSKLGTVETAPLAEMVAVRGVRSVLTTETAAAASTYAPSAIAAARVPPATVLEAVSAAVSAATSVPMAVTALLAEMVAVSATASRLVATIVADPELDAPARSTASVLAATTEDVAAIAVERSSGIYVWQRWAFHQARQARRSQCVVTVGARRLDMRDVLGVTSTPQTAMLVSLQNAQFRRFPGRRNCLVSHDAMRLVLALECIWTVRPCFSAAFALVCTTSCARLCKPGLFFFN